MFRPVSDCFSAARAILPRVVSRSVSFTESKTYRVLTNYRALGDHLADAIHEEKKRPWDEVNVTPLHLIASHFPTDGGELNTLNHLMGKPYPYIADHWDDNPTRDLLQSFAGIQDEKGNMPLQVAIERREWPLVSFLAENSPINYSKKNKAGNNVALTMVKSMPCQLTTTQKPFFYAVERFKSTRSLAIYLVVKTEKEGWEQKDENGWGLAHWVAFRGLKKEDFKAEFPAFQDKWIEKDHQGITPEDVEKLFLLISSEGLKGLSGLNAITFEKMPKERQAEFQKAIQDTIILTAQKTQQLLRILSSDLQKAEQNWVKSINV
ncbi:MAG: hypothetical protein ACK5MA_05700 [Parachlamydiaceae bacterium]